MILSSLVRAFSRRSPSGLAHLGLLLAVLAAGGVACSKSGGSGAGTCDNPTPILQPDGSPSGYVKCADGTVDRVDKVPCALQNVDTCTGDETFQDCKTSADCTAKPGGVCLHQNVEGPDQSHCGCVYQCQTDDDCGGGTACVCAGVSTRLGYGANPFCAESGNCKQPSDCASGECGMAEPADHCTQSTTLLCRTPDDACRTDAECGDADCGKKDVTGTWTCADPTCTL